MNGVQFECEPDEMLEIDGVRWFKGAVVERAVHAGEASAVKAIALALEVAFRLGPGVTPEVTIDGLRELAAELKKRAEIAKGDK